MDSYSGSEPRKFISFHLGEEKNGQPTQGPEVIEPEGSSTQANVTETQVATQGEQPEQQVVAMDQGAAQLQQSPSQSLISRFFGTDSSGSNESCGTYITCKMTQMEEAAAKDFAEVIEAAQRESVSEAMEIAHNTEQTSSGEVQSTNSPQVIFLNPTASRPDCTQPEQAELLPKRPRLAKTAPAPSVGIDQTQQDIAGLTSTQNERQVQDDSVTVLRPFGNISESDFDRASDSDSGQYVGSTLADALKTVPDCNLPGSSDQSSVVTPVNPPVTPRDASLGGRSRALIKEHFESSEKFRLPPGHPVVAFTESQISTVMRVVADETARASYDMLENLVYRASRLSLASRPGGSKASKGGSSRKGSSVVTSVGQNRRSSSEGYSDTSGALRSDDEFGSLGYSFEHSDAGVQFELPQPELTPGCSQTDLQSPHSSSNVDSPGIQTLAALKQEAVAERRQLWKGSKGQSAGRTSKNSSPRRKTSRPCKVMKEAYFRGMEWTRSFVSGPVDPRWNKYKFYCQICKANVSIYSKGAREILRHYATEKHLRKDQRWRYEYLYKTDPITKSRVPQVRGKDGKLLTPFQLALELPKFKDAELVDIGEKLPFYDEYMAGANHMSSSSENRARIQISVLGRFLPRYGDIDVLRSFWSDIGVVVNHQSLFTDFNWTKERLTVSPLLIRSDQYNISSCDYWNFIYVKF